MPSLFTPTNEQVAVVDAVRAGDDLKVKAYAGAGKTSTLRLIAQELSDRRGSYLAFNREIADHARHAFPSNVSARTVHSLAYSSVPSSLTARVNLLAEPPHELAERYGLGAIEAELITGEMAEISPFEVGRMIADGLGRFCWSSEPHLEPLHIPVDEKVHEDAAHSLHVFLLPSVVRLWNESINPCGRSAIVPDVYLKVWAETKPRIDADFILFDEAQDSDAVMLATLAIQNHAQTVYVGDPYQ